MAQLTWDDPEDRRYDAGLDRGVLYLTDGRGVPWNGLIAVNETSKDAELETQYQDGRKYRARGANGGFSAAVEAVSYPYEFEKYDGLAGLSIGQQPKKPFGLSYRTLKGNVDGLDSGYLLHIVYNAAAMAGQMKFDTIDDGPSVLKFTWNLEARPVSVGGRNVAHIVIDTSLAHPWVVESVENLLYGSEDVNPILPPPAELLEIFEQGSIVRVTDDGDGYFTVEGPDEYVYWIDADTFVINYPSAIWIDGDYFTVSSL